MAEGTIQFKNTNWASILHTTGRRAVSARRVPDEITDGSLSSTQLFHLRLKHHQESNLLCMPCFVDSYSLCPLVSHIPLLRAASSLPVTTDPREVELERTSGNNFRRNPSGSNPCTARWALPLNDSRIAVKFKGIVTRQLHRGCRGVQ
jgi:hypothetical protein